MEHNNFLFQDMLDSVGIRLPKYKVRELTLELQRTGELQDDAVDKMMFLQVNVFNKTKYFRLRLSANKIYSK